MTARKYLMATAAVAALALCGVAQATTIYTFDATDVGAFGAGPYGTVTLTQAGANVTVKVALRSDMNFVTTGGPHSTFSFMLAGAGTTDITSILFNGVANANYTVATPGAATPFGTNFSLMIDCTGAKCKNGAPGQIEDPLTFTVLNALESDFAPSLSNGGAYFASDVICTQVSTIAGCNGKTGSIGVTGRPGDDDDNDVPEPGSLALLGLGLIGIGAVRRRRIG